MDLSQRMDFYYWLLNLFENSILLQEPHINSWFKVPVTQI